MLFCFVCEWDWNTWCVLQGPTVPVDRDEALVFPFFSFLPPYRGGGGGGSASGCLDCYLGF